MMKLLSRLPLGEAGVRGDLVHFIGYYEFKSKTLQDELSPKGWCRAAVFALLVKEELESWPEQSPRQRSWLTVAEAMECCRYPWMREALGEGFSGWHADQRQPHAFLLLGLTRPAISTVAVRRPPAGALSRTTPSPPIPSFSGFNHTKSDRLPEFLPHPLIQMYSLGRIRVGLLEHHEAYCEDNYLVDGYLCHVDWSPGDVCSSTTSDLVATNIFHCFTGMLWIANGWHRPNALSNLSSRGIVVAAGHCRGQALLEAKRGRCWF
ncbi:hypothetical protein NL676_017035 [Syzygium grande]|nr:hypothetical protein NL676_017035 [Syzygium grande]